MTESISINDYSKCRSKYATIVDDNGHIIKNISNMGLKKFQQAFVNKNGEYSKFTIEALEDIKPLITHKKIEQAIKFIDVDNNLEQASLTLNVNDLYIKHGSYILYYLIDRWLEINNFNKKYLNECKLDQDLISELESIVKTQRHHPLKGKFKIVSTGYNTNTNTPVVPPEWINKEFKSADELHALMNTLENRKGKPLVNYCCIYSMNIKENNIWQSTYKAKGNDQIISIYFNNSDILITDIDIIKKEKIINGKILKIGGSLFINMASDIMIEFKNNSNNSDSNILKNIGYLSSLLQKCIRRGSDNRNILIKCMNDLNSAKPYNLPDHNFIRVSGTRQLLWRSYITIIEESQGYYVDKKINSNLLDLQDIIILSLISQYDSNLQLSDKVLKILTNTMIFIQQYPKIWNWRKYDSNDNLNLNIINSECHNTVLTSIDLAIRWMPMMKNDNIMLKKVINYIADSDNKLDIINENILKNIINKNIEYDKEIINCTIMASMDMHCRPDILILIQSIINIIPNNKYQITLEKISKYIWDNFSKYNYRWEKSMPLIPICHNKLYNFKIYDAVNRIQEILTNINKVQFDNKYDWIKKESNSTIILNNKTKNNDNYVGRLIWLLIFGQIYKVKHKNRIYEVIMAGNSSDICKIKKTIKNESIFLEQSEEKTLVQKQFFEEFITTKIIIPSPPNGYIWISSLSTKKFVKIDIEFDSSNSDVKFYIDKKEVKPFELSNLVIDIRNIVKKDNIFELNEKFKEMLLEGFYDKSDGDIFGEDITFILSDIANKRRELNDSRIFNWITLITENKYYNNTSFKMIINIFRFVLAKIYISDSENNGDKNNNIFSIQIGPCDRKGKKTLNSINYQFEGIILRFLIILESLYPSVLIRKGFLKFDCKKNNLLYFDMIDKIKEVIIKNNEVFGYNNNIVIQTKLWDHQQNTVNKIYNGFTFYNKRGFGDASHVGAGKTLSAISLMDKLYSNNKLNNLNKHGAFLVLVPSINLINTWTNEIKKHSIGFHIIVQQANGKFLDLSKNKCTIKFNSNSIIVSTMGRIRDHPIANSWILVIIDECLSVQNKDALQTEEAWRQTCYSQYGIIMLSATFFRSRFDKMLYMLKMLNSELPENRLYLDTILVENIICNTTKSDIVWKTNINKIELSKKQMTIYNNLFKINSSKSSEHIYNVLNNYIYSEVDYTNIYINKLKSLDNLGHKVVIFTKSKNEADAICKLNPEIGRYPLKLKHTCLSFAEGTYGLNDLVIYDTILMRVPEPDKLPQIKGRLDRPGQLSKTLYMEYVLLKDTIEEAFITRLELCNNFYNNYIMPLSEFYNLAINKNKIISCLL